MADKSEQASNAELERQLAALRDDFGGIAKLLQDMAQNRVGHTASQVRTAADTLSEDAARHGYAARDALDGAIKGNPAAALGVAAVLGFVLGAIVRR